MGDLGWSGANVAHVGESSGDNLENDVSQKVSVEVKAVMALYYFISLCRVKAKVSKASRQVTSHCGLKHCIDRC